jgi:hypothetical protein
MSSMRPPCNRCLPHYTLKLGPWKTVVLRAPLAPVRHQSSTRTLQRVLLPAGQTGPGSTHGRPVVRALPSEAGCGLAERLDPEGCLISQLLVGQGD